MHFVMHLLQRGGALAKTDANDETVPPPEETTEAPEAIATEAEPSQQYEFHIKLQGTDTDEKLKDAATVAYRLELIPKPILAQLMSSLIAWGSGYPQTTMV